MAYKPVGVDTSTSLFPPRVMNALKSFFAQKTDLATVAKTGNYTDLLNRPSSANAAQVFTQTTAATTWTFTHSLGRLPVFTVYDSNGLRVSPAVTASANTIQLVFGSASTGTVVVM